MGSAAGVAASLLVLLVAARAGGETDSLRSTAAVTFSTLVTTPLPVEGLTADAAGNLYTVGRALTPTAPCPVWRINVTSRSLAVVGQRSSRSTTGRMELRVGTITLARRGLPVRDGNMVSLQVLPAWDPLGGEPQCLDLLQRMKFARSTRPCGLAEMPETHAAAMRSSVSIT